MHETTAETGTHVSSHPGKDTEDALARATGQMRTYVRGLPHGEVTSDLACPEGGSPPPRVLQIED